MKKDVIRLIPLCDLSFVIKKIKKNLVGEMKMLLNLIEKFRD